MGYTRGVADVSVSSRSCSHVPEGLLHACAVHACSSCSIRAGIINREIVNL